MQYRKSQNEFIFVFYKENQRIRFYNNVLLYTKLVRTPKITQGMKYENPGFVKGAKKCVTLDKNIRRPQLDTFGVVAALLLLPKFGCPGPDLPS